MVKGGVPACLPFSSICPLFWDPQHSQVLTVAMQRDKARQPGQPSGSSQHDRVPESHHVTGSLCPLAGMGVGDCFTLSSESGFVPRRPPMLDTNYRVNDAGTDRAVSGLLLVTTQSCSARLPLTSMSVP